MSRSPGFQRRPFCKNAHGKGSRIPGEPANCPSIPPALLTVVYRPRIGSDMHQGRFRRPLGFSTDRSESTASMARQFVNTLSDGDTVEETYLLAEKQLRANRNANLYLL